MKASRPLSRLISTSLDYHFKGVSRAKFMETLAPPFIDANDLATRPSCSHVACRKGKGMRRRQMLREEGENSRGDRTKAGKYPGAPSHGAV